MKTGDIIYAYFDEDGDIREVSNYKETLLEIQNKNRWGRVKPIRITIMKEKISFMEEKTK